MLQWDWSFDGPWSEAAESRYREGGFDGLSLTTSTSTLPDLEFLHRLPGLRALSVQGRVKNDVAAFLIGSLEELSLVTGSRVRLPEAVQPALRNLVMANRPGIEVASRWPALESFRVGMWRGSDLQMLSGARKLVRFYAEGRRQAGSLEGIEGCRSIEQIIMVDYSICGTAPLRGLSMLSELRMLAAPPAGPHQDIDISDIADSRIRTLWISNAPVLRHMDALLEMRFLRNVRLIKCHLEAADRQVLDSLSARAKVEIF
jgi:hypothetical protein